MAGIEPASAGHSCIVGHLSYESISMDFPAALPLSYMRVWLRQRSFLIYVVIMAKEKLCQRSLKICAYVVVSISQRTLRKVARSPLVFIGYPSRLGAFLVIYAFDNCNSYQQAFLLGKSSVRYVLALLLHPARLLSRIPSYG